MPCSKVEQNAANRQKISMGKQENERNRRQRERLNLSLPIRVVCRETTPGESWDEITRLIDVTPFGAGFTMARAPEIGRLLQLTIPMPRQLRCYDHAEQQYKVWGLVRHVRKTANEQTKDVIYQIGVAFIGKHAPASFTNNPATLYEVIEPDNVGFWRFREVQAENAAGEKSQKIARDVDLRRFTRHHIPLVVTIEVFNERGETVASEITVTEDVSLTGAAVFTTLDVEQGRFIRLTSEEYEVTIVAIIRQRKTGSDGVARLHLEFIDRQFPLENAS